MKDGAPEDFNWGRIERMHSVGKYKIAEYFAKTDGVRLFHGWIDGKDTHESWGTVEEALIGMLARDRLEVNHARHSADCIAASSE